MLTQLGALIALRLRLIQRTWLRGVSGALASAFLVLTVLAFAGAALMAAIGLFFLGWQGFRTEDALLRLAVLDGLVFVVLVLWSLGILTEVQRADAVDFRRMLYLPVSLRMVFLLNFVASLATPLFLFFSLGCLGLTLGLALSFGPRMLWVPALAAAFYFMLAAWTYHLRGLMAILMQNKRRRQLVVMLTTIFFVLVTQLPNLFFQFARREAMHSPPVAQEEGEVEGDEIQPPSNPALKMETLRSQLAFYNAILPPAWLPFGVSALDGHRYGTAGLCLLGMTGLGALGLAVGYRSTYRYYTGAQRRRKDRAARAAAPSERKQPLTERDLPWVADDTAATAYAGLLTSMRHPFIRMQIIMPVIFGGIFLAPFFLGYAPRESGLFVVPFISYMILLSAGMILFNIFGSDFEGFQALILLPTPRHKYLLGRNLAMLPLLAIPFAVYTVVGALLVLPPVALVATLVIQFLQAYVSICIVGNYMSIYAPYRMRKDTMKGVGFKPAAFLSAIVGMFAIPLLLIPTGIAVGVDWLGRSQLDMPYLPLGVVVALAFLTLTLLLYRGLLPAAGDILLAREQQILLALQKDRE